MTATSDRLARWKDQYPDRLATARSLVMRLMGVPRDAQSPITLQAVEQTVDAVLCAVYGVEPDPIPERVLVPPASPPRPAPPPAVMAEGSRDRAIPAGDRE